MIFTKEAFFRKIVYAFIVALSSFFFVQSLFAHGEGASFEKEIGDYIVDIGYDPEKLEVGTPVKLDFELSKKVSKENVPFSSVWVRVEKEKQTVFASGIHRPEFGKTGLLYTFGEPGTYTISARFQNNEDNIAETSFTLAVSEAPSLGGKSRTPDKSVLWGMFGLIVGVVLGFVIKRKADNL